MSANNRSVLHRAVAKSLRLGRLVYVAVMADGRWTDTVVACRGRVLVAVIAGRTVQRCYHHAS